MKTFSFGTNFCDKIQYLLSSNKNSMESWSENVNKFLETKFFERKQKLSVESFYNWLWDLLLKMTYATKYDKNRSLLSTDVAVHTAAQEGAKKRPDMTRHAFLMCLHYDTITKWTFSQDSKTIWTPMPFHGKTIPGLFLANGRTWYRFLFATDR